MQIRRGKAEEIDKIMRIYEQARAFMRKNGNATQWDKGYPSRELILKEIEQGCQYVCEEEEAIVAVFSLCACWKRMDLSNVERSKWQTAQKESPFS